MLSQAALSEARVSGAAESRPERGPRILLADAQPEVMEALGRLLGREGMSVVAARSPASVLAQVQAGDYDAALIDLEYARDTSSGPEGQDLLAQLRALDGTLPLVVLTSLSGVAAATETVHRGARDYVVKPWNNGRLLTTLRAQLELGRALRRSRRLEEENARLRVGPPTLVARSPAMEALQRALLEAAAGGENVLITGEPGCGKEVVARLLHAASGRASLPLVAVEAGALTGASFETALFGQAGAPEAGRAERIGAFEVAGGGTLLLAQPGALAPAQQALLLRALQSGEFNPVGSAKVRPADVRVLSTSSVRLRDEAVEGRFRAALLYRLNTVELAVPPLRERLEDIAPLAKEFLCRQAARGATRARRLSPAAEDALLRHCWPGNVRELEHAIERAAFISAGEELEPSDLSLGRPPLSAELFERMTLQRVERELVRRALKRWAGNVEAAARDLGLTRSTLYRRMHQHGLKRSWNAGEPESA